MMEIGNQSFEKLWFRKREFFDTLSEKVLLKDGKTIKFPANRNGMGFRVTSKISSNNLYYSLSDKWKMGMLPKYISYAVTVFDPIQLIKVSTFWKWSLNLL